MKWPLWFRILRLAMMAIREPFFSPSFCMFFGMGLGMLSMFFSISGIGREMDGAFSQAITGVIQACQVAGK